ncbi:MAG TPA: tetratricopeptide repeat protein [Verrucomicrobiae bacterium]|nr:tetratricopeptide repeat protein [Verrucomicrobiae bacterium]
MTDKAESSASRGWSAVQVYTMAVICLVVGVALGYLFRGSASSPASSPSAQAAGAPASADAGASPAAMSPHMPSLDELKHMADKQAEPLLAQLKSDPKNADKWKQVARIYESTHQFDQAAGYFGKALEVNPKDAVTRIEMASCLYYNGSIDPAIAQLQQVLKGDPKNANSLFNLGMIRWKGKNDATGAVQAWQELLKTNPDLDNKKKAQVERLMTQVKASSAQ